MFSGGTELKHWLLKTLTLQVEVLIKGAIFQLLISYLFNMETPFL